MPGALFPYQLNIEDPGPMVPASLTSSNGPHLLGVLHMPWPFPKPTWHDQVEWLKGRVSLLFARGWDYPPVLISSGRILKNSDFAGDRRDCTS